MEHTFKRLLSAVVALFMVISMIPGTALSVFAAQEAVTMTYDDRLSITELGGTTASAVEISAQSVTSKQVGSDAADTAVLTYDSAAGTLIATGTGTATVTVDGTAHDIVVTAAPISLVMITGHSIGAGQTGKASQSVVCPDGQVYTTYGTSLAGAATAGVGLGYASASRPAGIDASTAAGDGTIGEGSALAYKWNQLTGEKIWVLNTSVGGTALTKWVQGGSCYTNAVAVYKYAQAVLTAEQAAGHYQLKDEAIIYHSAANWNYSDNGTWSDANGEGWYESMVEGYKTELGVETIGLVPIWTDSSKNSYSNDTPANFWMGANEEYPGLFVASVATRTWLRDISTFPAITYTTQSEAVTKPTDISGILATDNVHLDQVAYNAAGLDIAQNLYNFLRTEQVAASVVLRDGSHKELGEEITMAVGQSVKLVPEVAPVSVGDLTFTLSSNLSLSWPGVITGTGDGMGRVIVSQGDNVLTTLKVAVGDASEEIPVYPEDWSVEYHCVCGNPSATNNPCAKEGHKMVQWKPWTDTRTVPILSGYWYLPNDLDLTSATQYPYGTDFATSTGVIGREAVNGATVLKGEVVNVYVDLNGKTVTGRSGHRIYRLENDLAHTLTITDTAGGGKLIAKSGAGNTNQGMVIWTRNRNNRVTIYGGTLDASGATVIPGGTATNAFGGAIDNAGILEIYGGTVIGGTVNAPGAFGGTISNYNTLNIYGGTIQGGTLNGTTSANGATIYSEGTVNIHRGTIVGGNATAPNVRGGAIYNNNVLNIHGGTVTGGTITSNGASGSFAQGGTIFTDNGHTLNIYGGTILGGTVKNNTAQGGNIRNQGKLNIYGGTIQGGTADGSNVQGANVSNVGTFYMEGGTITGGNGNTTASASGGAFFTTTGGTMKGGTIIGGKLTKNSAVASGCCGGAIYVFGGTLTMDGGTVLPESYTANVAYQGATVYIANKASFVLNDGLIAAGKVNDYGGAVAVPSGGTFTMNGGTVTGTYYSNGTPVTDPADAHASGVTKVNNSAGAAVGAWGGTLKMTGGTIIGGKAGNVGGSLAVRYSGTFTMSGGLITGGTDAGGTSTTAGGGNVAVDYDNSHRPTFTMTGGTITDGRGTYPGVFVNRGGQINISGNAVITGNVDKNNKESNLILMDNNGSGASYGLKVVVGEMGSDAHIGVTMATPGVFTSAAVSEANAAAFYGDAGHYVERNADGTLSLVKGHKGHCVCGGTTDRCDHTALEGEWKPWDGKSNISEGGNYYLTQTVSTNQWWMGGSYQNTTEMTINLCLNGHSITSSGRVFGIAPNVTLNLMNCSHGESVLTGKQSAAQGGTVFMFASSGTFNLYGNIKLVGTGTTTRGGVVYANGAFNMYGGTICGGTATDGEGGGNVFLTNGTVFNMYDGEIYGGTSTTSHGGNLKITQDCVVNILGGIIRDGKVTIAADAADKDKNGGNIAMVDQDSDDLGSLTIGGDAVISGGHANRGGNIFIHTGSLIIKDQAKILGGTEDGYSQGGAPCVEVNWSRDEATANNRTYVAISGTPEITDIRYADYIDTTGLEAGAKIGVNRKSAGKVSSGALAADVASGFTSTNKNLVIVSEDDALYAKDPATIHYHDMCNGGEAGNCDHSSIYFKTPITDVTQIVAPGNYYLDADITDAAELTLTGSGVINLCLNGHTWAGATRTIVVPKGITLNISNCSETEGVISGKGHPTENATTSTTLFGRALFLNGGTVNVFSGVTLKAADASNTGAYVNEAEKINWQRQGGVISTVGGVLNIYGATVDGNGQTATTGGVIRSQSSTVITIVGGVLKNGKATNGGAIMINGGDKLTVTGTAFQGNYASGKAAAIYNLDATMTVDGATFANNTVGTSGEGGLFYSNAVSTTLKNMSISGMTAKYGGVLAVNKGTVNVESTVTISNCSVTEGGGAIYLVNGTVNFAGTIENCHAKYGGSIYQKNGTFNMTDGSISGSYSTGSGGGSAMIDAGTFNLSGGIIEGGLNKKEVITDVYGGGNLMVYGPAVLKISGGTVRGGNATFGGNISLTDGGTLIMTGGLVEGGTSTGGHGGNISIRATCTATITGGTVKDGVANAVAGATTQDALDKCGGNISIVHSNASTTRATLNLGGNAQILDGEGDRAGNIFLHSGVLNIYGAPTVTGGTGRFQGYTGNANVHVNFQADNGNNSCIVTIAGKPVISDIRLVSPVDMSGLEAGAQLGITADNARQISQAPLSAEVAKGITSTSKTLKVVNETNALYLRALDYHVYGEGVQTKAPTCTEEGVLTYTCQYCGHVKTEAIDALGHTEVIDAAVEATCTQTGLTEGSHCDVCGEVLVEQQIVPKDELTYVAEVPATCHQNGTAEYWYCAECDIIFADADATQQTNIKNLTILATVGLTHVEAVEATCHQNGMQEYWYCSECDAVFADAAGTQLTNRKNLTIPATVGLTYVPAEEATCHQNGHAEYWYCSECDAIFSDAAGTQLTNIKNLTVAANPLTHVAAVEATCHQNGMQEYWYCETCDAVFSDAAGIQLTNRRNLVIPYTAEIVHVDAVEATCHQTGNVEYWYCAECDAVFTDAALTQLSNFKSVITPATAEIIHVEAVEANCHQNGSAEYWYCAECETVFADAALTQLTNVKNLVIPHTAEIIHVDAVEANCHQNGSAEYWYCAECETVFADAALTQLTNVKNLVIPYTAEIIHVDAVEANCHQTGNVEYWYCAECDAVFTDAALTQLSNFKSVITPATAEIIHVEAVEATCHQNGSAEYWYCAECETVFADAALTQLTNVKNLVIPYTAEIIHVDAVEANCHQTGNVEYWYCAECDAVFTDAALTQLSNFKSVITPATVGLTHVEALEPTYNADGHYEYWYCAECDAVFADAAGTQLTNRKNLTIPALQAMAQIGTVKFGSLAEAVAAANDNDEIVILKDHESAGAVIDKSITINFNGCTVTLTSGVGSGSLTSNGLQLLKNNTVTLKGGKLTVAEESKSLFYILVQNYADLTVVDMTLDGTNLDKWSTHEDQVTNGDSFTLSVNNGTVNILGATTIIANNEGSKAFAVDSCDNAGYEGAPTVNINTTGTIGKLNCDGGAYAISGGYFTEPVAAAYCAEGFVPVTEPNADGKYTVVPALPTATITELKNDKLTFAMNFLADKVTDAQKDYYGGWYADFVLKLNKDATFNANGTTDGYLGGQYDVWDDEWVYVPDSNVTMKANEALKIMEYAAQLLGKPGLKLTYNDVLTFVKDFDCGVYFTDAYLLANPDLVVTLELRMFNPENENESYVIGQTYIFKAPQYVASVTDAEGNVSGYMTLAEALAAAESGDTVDLLTKVTVDGTETWNIPAGVTLNLPENDNYAVIVKGDLTLEGEGTVHVEGKYGIGLSTSCTGGLTVNGSLTFTAAETSYYTVGAFAGKVTVNGGTFSSPYCVINSFAGYNAQVEINGGTFLTTGTDDDSAAPVLGINVTVNSGFFSHQVPDEYCAEGLISTVIPNENGLYTVEEKGDSVARNLATGKLYTTVMQALMEADGTDATIQMIADSTEYNILVPAGVTLELNGKTLTASYVNAFGPVCDSTGTGLLKGKQGKVNLFAQVQFPVWNGEGYIFVSNIALSEDTNVRFDNTEEGLKFTFLPVLNAEMRALMANGGADNGVKLVVRMNWGADNANIEQPSYDVVFDDAFVQKVYSSATAQYAFVLTLANAADMSDLSFNIVLVSDTGAELVSQTVLP